MQLEAKTRTVFGKKVSSLRREGFIPGEIYGHGTENMHVSVSEKELLKVWKEAHENTIVTLSLENEKFPVLISEIEFTRLTQRPLTVDFRKVQKGEKIKVYVPIALKGSSLAEKEGLNVMQTLSEVEIETLPTDIPHEFSVDVSALSEVGQIISVNDLSLPKGVKLLAEEHTVIVTVTEKQKEEPIAPPPVAESAEETPVVTTEPTEKTPE